MSQAGAVITFVDVSGKSRQAKLYDEIASGGAGTVFSVEGEPQTVVKVYNQKTLGENGLEYEAKITFMLKHVPTLPIKGDFIRLSWPQSIARDSAGEFIGFSMPMIDFGKTESLESMLQPKQAQVKSLRSDLGARMTVAVYLALVVNAIHKEGYHIVDLKPPNLQFYKKELYVTVLDCDGFDIRIPGRTFAAPQATPEYLAPEYHQEAISDPERQDRFALAAIIFRLLNFGIHPYDGIVNDNNVPMDREGRVSHGLYPYGRKMISALLPLPVSAHQTFPKELRDNFDRAFGDSPSMRPSSREWSDILRKYAVKKNALLVKCKAGHYWFIGASCGECHRNSILQAPATNILNSKNGANIAFDLGRVWRKIQSITPPNAVSGIHPNDYSSTPLPPSPKMMSLARLITIQRFLICLLVPLVAWQLNAKGLAILAMVAPVAWTSVNSIRCYPFLDKILDSLASWSIRFQKALLLVLAILVVWWLDVNIFVALTITSVLLYYNIERKKLKYSWFLVLLTLWSLEGWLLLVVAVTPVWYAYPIGIRRLREEFSLRESVSRMSQGYYNMLKSEWDMHGSEKIFYQKYQNLEEQKFEYESLPETLNDHLNSVHDQLRETRLEELLEKSIIKPGQIYGVGTALIDQLNRCGIYCAADIIDIDEVDDIPGFGQVRIDLLSEWRDNLISSFRYDRKNAISPAEMAALKQPFSSRQKSLESRLQQGPDILESSLIEIIDYRKDTVVPLRTAAEKLSQALADASFFSEVKQSEFELGINRLMEKCRQLCGKV